MDTKEEIYRAVQKALEEELGNFTKDFSYKVATACEGIGLTTRVIKVPHGGKVYVELQNNP
jgi:hypothetical protein